jgi:type VI secretion system protein VasD
VTIDEQRGTEHRPTAAGGWRGRVARGAGQAAALLAALVLAACSSPLALFKATPTSVSGSIVGAADLNPSVNKRPSPLLLRVYELRSPTAFNQAEFMALYQADQATLGPDLVAREELTLQPGETRPLAKQLGPDTKFLGVVGIYRDLEHARWRAVLPVQPNRAQKVTIRAEALALSAAVLP